MSFHTDASTLSSHLISISSHLPLSLLLQAALSSHAPATFQPYLASLLPPIITLADDRYYKTVAEVRSGSQTIAQCLMAPSA
jgi:hypothetical protein